MRRFQRECILCQIYASSDAVKISLAVGVLLLRHLSANPVISTNRESRIHAAEHPWSFWLGASHFRTYLVYLQIKLRSERFKSGAPLGRRKIDEHSFDPA